MEKTDVPFQWWLPFTPGGMVLIAYGPLKRFMTMSVLIAFLGSLVISWFFVISWKPVIDEAISHLPGEAAISEGILHWQQSNPIILGKNSFLSIIVDSEGRESSNQSADVQFELGHDDFRIGSLLGFVRFEYSSSMILNLGRAKIEPWWGAWHPIVILGLGFVSFLILLLSESLFALFCAVPLWLFCKIFSKRGSFLHCWRITQISQVPGAIWLNLSLGLYCIGHLDITGFLISFLIYFFLAGIYLLLVPFFIPGTRHQSKDNNPFAEKPSHSFSGNSV